MAHAIDMSNGRANMAYAGEKPWHGLGFKINPDATIEEWRKASGLDFSILKGKMFMENEAGLLVDVSHLNRSVLYRSDTGAALSVMSTKGFNIVQPDEILGFIGDTVKAMGWKMETAGSLHGGRKVWALANTGESADVGPGDRVGGYLLAATACDGTMASDFRFTSVCVVCDNTLQMAVRDESGQSRVKVYHFAAFDPEAVKKSLGIAGNLWTTFIEQAKQLASMKISQKQAKKILRSVYETPKEKEIVGDKIITDDDFIGKSIAAKKVLELFSGAGIRMDLSSRKNTAWGLVNATTEFYDHRSNTRSTDNRLHSAWFGEGNNKKQEVVDACLAI